MGRVLGGSRPWASDLSDASTFRSGRVDLVRIVRTAEGTAAVDETSKRSGRGAYLCRQRVCWDTALAQRQLERALKVTLSAEQKVQLQEYASDLPEFLATESEDGG